ncbi:MAG: hypothetical protein CMC25_02550 [Flavobacteriaceae bacterium]|nr:hypothetical protein [Flavobacteriaceae bacterium]|tara:strand:+ start:2796 stop:6050 length:3255 start_codon:yes stop_codon:yes gene_type:complete
MKNQFLVFVLGILIISCDSKTFELKDNNLIGVNFSNNLKFNDDFNVYKYRNFYNGGGVALGDINNDDLLDIYLTSNQGENKLFLNLGDFKFKDITEFARVGGEKAWSTGVTMVDINGDGYLDIYVCNSGDVQGDNKQNELFINNGDLTFKESALEYNLNDKGFSTHANFFDYDKDGDLDVYILNNSFQAIGSFDLRRNERPKRDVLGGDKLMRNDNGYFNDVSESAGIYGSVIGFGLGITIGDIDGDNWDDIFISNDFFERDYLYLNQKNGTFKEDLINRMNSISGASMGADIADIDNNGTNDIFVTEMLPSDYKRLKSVTTFEGWDKYKYNVKNGYHHQFTRNVLHLNIENNKFSEVGRFSGVEASDWSWGALFFDFDNDGLKDLFIANGIYKDLTDQDYLQYISNKEVINSIVSKNKVDYKKLVEIIPSNPISNHSYKNLDGLKFENFNNSGLENPSFSNGSAYGDLDNDGDLDLVVNNVNMSAFIYENQTNKKANYIKFKLIGENRNIFSVGAKVYIKTNGVKQMQQIQSARGFQSSVDLRPNFGIGKNTKIDAKIVWPSGKTKNLFNLEPNQTITLYEKDAVADLKNKISEKENIFRKVILDSIVNHEENNYVDFNKDRLLFHMCSSEGPNLAFGEIDNSGYNSLFLSGSLGNYIKSFQVDKNNLIKSGNKILSEKLDFENSVILLLDVDNDNDLDLYIGSGSVELSKFSEKLYDRIYINNGKGKFNLSGQKLPDVDHKISTGTASFEDIDKDGDLDIFVGERLKINNYGLPSSGFMLVNDGKGNFSNQTQKLSPELNEIGMITDSEFSDIDNDGDKDLVIVGEYMGIEIFTNDNGYFSRLKSDLGELKGWWNEIQIEDLNNDGLDDLIIGNHGLNSRFEASKNNPIRLYHNDFDNNGFAEAIVCFTAPNGKEYPYSLRHDLIDQIKTLKKTFPDYNSFKDLDIKKIIGVKPLSESILSEVNYLETSIFINEGNLKFRKIKIPKPVQFSPIYAIETFDFDYDGDMDIIMGGNLYNVKPEFGRYDASYGVYLENIDGEKFNFYNNGRGFFVEGQIRDLKVLNDKIYVAKNNSDMEIFQIIR